jgi:hypothetical protein
MVKWLDGWMVKWLMVDGLTVAEGLKSLFLKKKTIPHDRTQQCR